MPSPAPEPGSDLPPRRGVLMPLLLLAVVAVNAGLWIHTGHRSPGDLAAAGSAMLMLPCAWMRPFTQDATAMPMPWPLRTLMAASAVLMALAVVLDVTH